MTKESKENGYKTIGLLDLEPKRAESLKNLIEKKIKSLPSLNMTKIKGLDELSPEGFDAIVLYSWNLDEEQFLQWLQGFETRWSKDYSIWIPALIISTLDLFSIPEILERTTSSNWYFDVVHPDHISSLPIRVANLLRIHDHLRELMRYERELKLLQNQVHSIEQQLGLRKKEDSDQ